MRWWHVAAREAQYIYGDTSRQSLCTRTRKEDGKREDDDEEEEDDDEGRWREWSKKEKKEAKKQENARGEKREEGEQNPYWLMRRTERLYAVG